MKINREMLHKIYMQKVDEIVEECDWVTSMGPKEIVDLISSILEENPVLIENN
jgi:Asp-tRNA(Asn)/Glu-tRNA(Gln) amidotransferase B subunit